jgi:hypothetical protein
MKKLAILFAGLFIMAISVQNVNAQNEATEASDAAARIITILEITNDGSLHFGDIVPSAAAGTVTVSPAGARTKDGGVTLLSQYTTHQPAQFTVNGQDEAEYSINLPTDTPEPVKLSLTGADDMEVTAFTHNAVGELDGGSEQFEVGATLNVNASQAPGLYQGTFNVNVIYN